MPLTSLTLGLLGSGTNIEVKKGNISKISDRLHCFRPSTGSRMRISKQATAGTQFFILHTMARHNLSCNTMWPQVPAIHR